MSIIETLTPFLKKVPPENVDLFVCDMAKDAQDRIYEVMRFYHKGSVLDDDSFEPPDMSLAPRERLLRAIFEENPNPRRAEKTGYYLLAPFDDDHCVLNLMGINPLDSAYAIINPEDE